MSGIGFFVLTHNRPESRRRLIKRRVAGFCSPTLVRYDFPAVAGELEVP